MVPLPDLTRRAFLLGSAAVVIGAACGGGGDDEDAIDVPKSTANDTKVSLLIGSFPTLAGVKDERLALLLFQGDRDPVADNVTATLAVAQEGQQWGPETPLVRHGDGLLRPYYLGHATFTTPGTWGLRATLSDGRQAIAAVSAEDPAAQKSPQPGQPMISAPTPTVADPRGTNPLCTRQPQCPFHDVSLDAALKEKRPLAVLFATPARCQTDTCGPVLDVLMEERAAIESRMRIIHVEIFTALEGNTTTEAVQAYQFQSEPYLYLAGSDGAVKNRIGGVFDRAEVRDALAKLA